MEYRYHPQRFRDLPDGRRVGTVNVGDIIYIQDGVRPFSFPTTIIRRQPWKVEAWTPRDPVTRDPETRRYKTVRVAGGHLALVRSYEIPAVPSMCLSARTTEPYMTFQPFEIAQMR